ILASVGGPDDEPWRFRGSRMAEGSMSAVRTAPAKPVAGREPYPRNYATPAELRSQIQRLQETSFPITVATALADHATIFGLVAVPVLAWTRLSAAAAAAGWALSKPGWRAACRATSSAGGSRSGRRRGRRSWRSPGTGS